MKFCTKFDQHRRVYKHKQKLICQWIICRVTKSTQPYRKFVKKLNLLFHYFNLLKVVGSCKLPITLNYISFVVLFHLNFTMISVLWTHAEKKGKIDFISFTRGFNIQICYKSWILFRGRRELGGIYIKWFFKTFFYLVRLEKNLAFNFSDSAMVIKNCRKI